jgi:hypothetical protein
MQFSFGRDAVVPQFKYGICAIQKPELWVIDALSGVTQAKPPSWAWFRAPIRERLYGFCKGSPSYGVVGCVPFCAGIRELCRRGYDFDSVWLSGEYVAGDVAELAYCGADDREYGYDSVRDGYGGGGDGVGADYGHFDR